MNYATTKAIPTHDEITASARSIVERLRANARESDRQGYLLDDSFEALRDNGLLQILTPRRCGGWEGTMSSVFETASIVAEGDPGAAWHVMIGNGNVINSGRLDESIQDEIFAEHPGTIIASAIMPNGLAKRVEGGWRVSGRFNFVSAIRHATWFAFITFEEDENGERGATHAMYCPAEEVTQLDTWDTLGMRGSGSPDVELRDVFIPDSRVSKPVGSNDVTEAAKRQATNLFITPTVSVFPLLISGTILGAAKRALEIYIERVQKRIERYTERAKSESQAQLIRIAKVSAEIKSAEMLLRDAAAKFDVVVERDGKPSLEERTAIKWQAVYAIDVLRKAVTTLYDAAGASVIYQHDEFLSTFRNVHVGSHHAACDFDPGAEMFGRYLLGLEIDERAV